MNVLTATNFEATGAALTAAEHKTRLIHHAESDPPSAKRR